MQDLPITLRGQQVTVKNITIAGADRSVGIMSDYVDDYNLYDAAGNELDWIENLTDDELRQIDDAIFKALDERVVVDPPDDYESAL